MCEYFPDNYKWNNKIDVLDGRKRFQLKLGKFGTYFYDRENKRELTNEQVLEMLERYDYLNNRCENRLK